MSEKIDRRIGNPGLLLTTIVIILVLAAAAGSYLWLRMSDMSAAPASSLQQSAAVPPVRSDEPLTITLFIPGNGVLSSGVASIKRQPDAQEQARDALIAALANAQAAQTPVLKELALRGFFLEQEGTAYVDLQVPPDGIRASAREEFLAIYAIVDMLAQNFEEIKQVRFMRDGREAQTLAGHIDLSRKFTKRMDLVKQ